MPNQSSMAGDDETGKGESSLSFAATVAPGNSTIESTISILDLQKTEDNLFRCSKCENFETQSHSLFLVHSVQCTTSTSKQAYDENTNRPSENGKTQPTARKLFECDVCNMKFSNGANMRRHKMRHTGVKPYECRVCQKRFFRKDHLAEHFTTHTKTLPYHCPICNRGFQRQIAMRAHFQNEHVGQHDLVKTCPLCSYRGGSMKSLRVHFFNRHGIDLDNPGSAGANSMLLASSTQASAQYHPSLITTSTVITPSYSDSGESFRSIENATPPMHFLTPHVEISIATNNENVTTEDSKYMDVRSSLTSCNNSDENQTEGTTSSQKLITLTNNLQNNNHIENDIVPSISVVPIKQEQTECETFMDHKNMEIPNTENNTSDIKNYNSIIKVSPLKSLLREDLKRRICARASNRASRNLHKENNNIRIPGSEDILHNVSANVNGCFASSTQELDLSSINRKKSLQCKFCRIEFPDQTLYFLHKGCHSDSNPWKCNICGEQCNSVYEFNSHLLSKSHQ